MKALSGHMWELKNGTKSWKKGPSINFYSFFHPPHTVSASGSKNVQFHTGSLRIKNICHYLSAFLHSLSAAEKDRTFVLYVNVNESFNISLPRHRPLILARMICDVLRVWEIFHSNEKSTHGSLACMNVWIAMLMLIKIPFWDRSL